jgi:hypothetical protein
VCTAPQQVDTARDGDSTFAEEEWWRGLRLGLGGGALSQLSQEEVSCLSALSQEEVPCLSDSAYSRLLLGSARAPWPVTSLGGSWGGARGCGSCPSAGTASTTSQRLPTRVVYTTLQLSAIRPLPRGAARPPGECRPPAWLYSRAPHYLVTASTIAPRPDSRPPIKCGQV